MGGECEPSVIAKHAPHRRQDLEALRVRHGVDAIVREQDEIETGVGQGRKISGIPLREGELRLTGMADLDRAE
jgi:hypothetical protein